MKGRVLVTGASGFIGWHCLAELRKLNYEVYALGRKKDSNPNVDGWCVADILDCNSAGPILDEVQPTHLLHLAWITRPGIYWTSPENLDWLNASFSLLRLFADRAGKRAVVAGSCAQYDWTCDEFIEGQTPCRPGSLYGASKLALSVVAERYLALRDVSFAEARLFFQFGPRERPERLVPQMICGFLANKPVECRNADLVRDILPVQEVAGALSALVDSDVQGAFNIGSGVGQGLGELASTIANRMGKMHLLKLGRQPDSAEPTRMVADIRRLHEELGWSPRMSLDEGIESAIQWWTRGT